MVVHKKCLQEPCPGNHFYRGKNRKAAPPPNDHPTKPLPQPPVGKDELEGPRPLAEAMFDFPPENDRELRLKKGDKVEVYQISGEWWFGAIITESGPGAEGYFPGAYVRKIGDWELAD